MNETVFWLLLLLRLGIVIESSSPCDINNHYRISTNGFRSSDFNSKGSDILICDDDLSKDKWYRFDLDAGIRLIEMPVEPFYCGTHAPIWLNGSHPTDDQQITQTVCATYSSVDYCRWSGNITIQSCNQEGEVYFVYKLAIPDGCAFAYCVDAATRKNCQPPQVWLPHEYQCGKNSTPPPTTTQRSTTPVPTIPSGSTGWSQWGSWSPCSKPCDYGIETRKRTCQELPCQGPSTETQTCNKYNCKVLEDEKGEGIVLEYNASPNEETMMTVIEKERQINDYILASLNQICSANISICCGIVTTEHLPDGIAFVTSDDVYTSQGYPRQQSDGNVIQKVVAVTSDYIYDALCKGTSKQIVKRETEKHYLDYEIMKTAVSDCEAQIEKETGLSVEYGHPDQYPIEEEAQVPSSDSCPVETCVIPFVVCGILALVLIIALIVFLIKSSKKSNRVDSPFPSPSPSPPPPPPYVGAILVAEIPSAAYSYPEKKDKDSRSDFPVQKNI